MQDELGALMDRLREDAGRLSAELRSLEAEVVEIAPPARSSRPRAVAAEPRARRREPEEPEPDAEPGPRRRGQGRDPDAAGAARRSPTTEAARLVALDMALGGTPREETEKYLAEHYTLEDPAAVLDDVYALAGS